MRALTVPCPRCAAAPGEPCHRAPRRQTGHRPHISRIRAADAPAEAEPF